MKGGGAERAFAGEHLLIESADLLEPRFGRMDADLLQSFVNACRICGEQVLQRFDDTLMHLRGGLAGKGNSEDCIRCGARQQQPDDTAHQQPRLAAPGGRQHRHMAAWPPLSG